MPEPRFIVRPGETVTAFALGPLVERDFRGEAAPMVDTVDYRFVNGFTNVGDLPCRIATWEEVKARSTPELQDFEVSQIRLPGFSRRLDFTGFWHLPCRLSRWAKTRIAPPQDGECRFRLATCGGVHIWVDGELATAFQPFSRNKEQVTEIDLALRAGGSEVVLLAEEMAERDTEFFVELEWLGPGDLAVEVAGQAEPEVLEALMEMARTVRPAKVAFGAGDALDLVFDAAASGLVTIRGEVGQSVHLTHLPPLFRGEAEVAAGEVLVSLGETGGLGDGYHPLTLTFEAGETRVERQIAFALLADQVPHDLPRDLRARKTLALEHAVDHGEARIGRLLAMMATGRAFDDSARAVLADTLAGIVSRKDCSDFAMVPLLWLYAEGRDWLPEEAARDIRGAVLGYRYWMDEPGNDAMWFWSENHVLCFHVSEYLAGGLFGSDVFPNSGMSGDDHRALAEARLGRWFDAVEAHGLAEWNSAAYYPIDFIGLLALQHLGEGALRDRATAVLDALFGMIALHTIGGVSAGSMGRAYDKELRAGPLTELAPFAAVAFGRGWLNAGVAALPMFCAGDYAPPETLARLTAPEGQIEARYVQGYGEAGRLALCKTAHMKLSACVDGKPGALGHQQHLVDVQAAGDPFARVWVNHPGQDDPWGQARPSYWAGNGVMPRVGMEGDCALVLFGSEGGLGFTHAYAPLDRFDDVRSGRDWMVLQSGAGAIVLKATGAIETVTAGAGAGLEHRVAGRPAGWAVAIAGLGEDGVDALAADVALWELVLNGAGRMTLRRPGHPELMLDWDLGLFRDGERRPFPTRSRKPVIGKTLE